MCVQGHVSGALPPPTYGLRGPLTLSQSTFVPQDQTPYTPSSFSGLDSVPSPPVPFQPPPSPGQNPSSGQARAPTLPSASQPLQNPSPHPVTPSKALAAKGTPSGTPQHTQHAPYQAGSWEASGKAERGSSAPNPPAIDAPAFIGGHGSDSTALHLQQKGSKLVLLVGIQKAPTESPSVTRPGQIIFESSSTVLALGPRTPAALASRGYPVSQPVAGPRTASQAEGAPPPVTFWPLAPFRPGSTAAEQASGLLKSGISVQTSLTTQDIAVSGTPQMLILGSLRASICCVLRLGAVAEHPSLGIARGCSSPKALGQCILLPREDIAISHVLADVQGGHRRLRQARQLPGASCTILRHFRRPLRRGRAPRCPPSAPSCRLAPWASCPLLPVPPGIALNPAASS